MKKHHFLFLILCLLLAFMSCKKEDQTIGNEIVTEENQMDFAPQSFKIKTELLFPEDIKLGIADTMLLGTYTDNLYGNLSSEFMVQFKGTYPYPFPENATPQSINLYLYYKHASLNVQTPQEIEVYELDRSFNDEKSSNTNPYEFIGNLLGTGISIPNDRNEKYTLKYSENDSVSCYRIKINLDIELAKALLQGKNKYENNDTFEELFHGLLITAPRTVGSLYNIFDAEIALTYDYIDKGETKQNTFTFITNTLETKRLNIINNENIETAIPDTGDSIFYIKSPAGIYSRITFPASEIRKAVDKEGNGGFVNNASLFFEITSLEDITTTIYRPSFLLLVKEQLQASYLEDERTLNAKDAVVSSLTQRVIKGDTITGYEFQIGTYVNDLVAGNNDSIVVIAPIIYGNDSKDFVKPLSSISSAIIRSENNQKTPLKLNVYYSSFK